MKYKLLFIALLCGFIASAQPGNYLYRATRERLIAGAADSTFHVPAGASVSLRGGGWPRAGALFVDTVGADTGFYYMGHNKFHRLLRSDEAVPGATNNTNAGSGFRWLLPGDQTIKSAINGYGIIWDSATAGSLKATADTGTLFPAVRATIPPLYNLYTNDSIISDPTDSVRRITLASGNKLFFRRGETGYPENFNIPPFTFTFKDTITSNTYYNHARHGFYTLRTSVFNPGAPTNRQYTHGSENAWNIQIGDSIRLNPTGGDAITANTTNFILTRSGATTGRAVAKLGTVMYDATASHISNFIVNGGGGGNWIRVRGPIAGSIAYLNAGSSLDTIDYWQAFASSGTGSAHKLKSIDFAAGFGGSPNTDTSYSFISPIELSRMYQAGDLMVGPNPGMPIPGLTLDGDGIPIIGQFNDPSAKLQVNSTTKGFLPPRMTEAQKNAIASPAAGLLVYQTDATAGYYYYNGSAWTAIGGASGGLFARTDSRNNTAAAMLFSGADEDMTLDSVGFFQMNASGSQFDMDNGFIVNTNPGGAYSGFISSDNVGNVTLTGRNLAADTIVQLNMEALTGHIEISTPGKLFLKASGYAVASNGDVLALVDNATGEVGWVAPGAGSAIWNSIANPTGNLSLSFDDAELSTFTNGSNTETFWTQANNSLTTGIGYLSSSSSITTGNLASFVSTSTAANNFSLVNINSSGANANSTRTSNGLNISVTNTGTASTNNGIVVTASGGTTNNAIVATGNATVSGSFGVGTTAFTDPISGTAKAKIDAGTTEMTFTDNGGQGWLAVTNGSMTGFVGHTNTADGFVVGTFSNTDFVIRSNNTNRVTIKNTTGNVGFHTSSATAKVHIAAGTTASSTAPLKFTSGTNMSTPEAGAVEWNGTQLFLTSSAAARHIVAQVSGSTALTSGTTPVATTDGRLTDGLILASGTYTPTQSGTNIASSSGIAAKYDRVGTEVSFTIQALITTTATGSTTLKYSLPSGATSNFTAASDVMGIATDSDDANTLYFVSADTTNDIIQITFTAPNTASHPITVQGKYTIK